MSVLRNPYAIRDDKMIHINDLSPLEQGKKCNCKCPHCEGAFIARMGEKRIRHFAHSIEPCDEIVAYTTGLYKFVLNGLLCVSAFPVPALTVSYTLPHNYALDESNVAANVKIARNNYIGDNKLEVSRGKRVSFDGAELVYDGKGRIQAIELSYRESKMAVVIKPPRDVCREFTVSAYKNMATLVFDFSDDINLLQNTDSKRFHDKITSGKLIMYWIHNPKVEKIYPKIIALSEAAYQEHLKRQREQDERKKFEAARYADYIKNQTMNYTSQSKKVSTGNYLIRCEICKAEKPNTEFFAGRARNICVPCRRSLGTK